MIMFVTIGNYEQNKIICKKNHKLGYKEKGQGKPKIDLGVVSKKI